ncbi:pilus assembly protein [Altererythrobacter sp. SALINAS58]|uniref:TadE/TadG family type IV pilus assembly protein n=1 Tax=Alteripontixanthobacter muriae TaxID=2705546 RepID=UPI001575FF97|nr:TadE family protein [Alteripontixanthobacter muriae]NTZ41646.1 pilus assembly protein [Alteripontixanthobacter muriae]
MIQRISNRLLRNSSGTVIIETAIVAPVLALLALGAFEIGSIASRYQVLESGAAESEMIMLTFADGGVKDTSKMEQVIAASLNIAGAEAADKVQIETRFRCNTETVTYASRSSCATDDLVSEMLILNLRDRYTPTWTSFGVGSPVDFNIERSVQVE